MLVNKSIVGVLLLFLILGCTTNKTEIRNFGDYQVYYGKQNVKEHFPEFKESVWKKTVDGLDLRGAMHNNVLVYLRDRKTVQLDVDNHEFKILLYQRNIVGLVVINPCIKKRVIEINLDEFNSGAYQFYVYKDNKLLSWEIHNLI